MDTVARSCGNCQNLMREASNSMSVPRECYTCFDQANEFNPYPTWRPVTMKEDEYDGYYGGSEDYLEKTKQDMVNHPKHYTDHPSGVECIQVTEHMNFCLGNAMKYIWRAGLKSDSPVEDLSKAKWYIERELKRLEQL